MSKSVLLRRLSNLSANRASWEPVTARFLQAVSLSWRERSTHGAGSSPPNLGPLLEPGEKGLRLLRGWGPAGARPRRVTSRGLLLSLSAAQCRGAQAALPAAGKGAGLGAPFLLAAPWQRKAKGKARGKAARTWRSSFACASASSTSCSRPSGTTWGRWSSWCRWAAGRGAARTRGGPRLARRPRCCAAKAAPTGGSGAGCRRPGHGATRGRERVFRPELRGAAALA